MAKLQLPVVLFESVLGSLASFHFVCRQGLKVPYAVHFSVPLGLPSTLTVPCVLAHGYTYTVLLSTARLVTFFRCACTPTAA